jgi:hypothetical protein
MGLGCVQFILKIDVLMCRQPAMRAPFSGCSSAYFSRVAMRPGISFSARSISRRPNAERLMSATLNLWAGADIVAVRWVDEGEYMLWGEVRREREDKKRSRREEF